MSFVATTGLGAAAGLTILIGLPVARLGRLTASWMSFLTAASVGVLLFLFFDIIAAASETVEGKLDSNHLVGAGYGLLLAGGLAIGLVGLVLFERLAPRRGGRPGPGAMAAAADAPAGSLARTAAVRPRREPLGVPERIALYIAIGIGLHNFSEGLAIGQSARQGAYSLFYLLVIGFGLHNATEGFGITAPLLSRRPSWRFLGMLGVIGGGPTFLGSLLGWEVASPAVSVLFLGLAAGAIVYVIGELQHAGRKLGAHDVAMAGLLSGFLVAYGTDLLLRVAGG